MIRVFVEALEQALARGEIHSPQSVGELARYYFSSVSGLRTMVKAGASREELEPIARLVMKTLQ